MKTPKIRILGVYSIIYLYRGVIIVTNITLLVNIGFLYCHYENRLETKFYAGSTQEKVFILSIRELDKKNKTKRTDFFLRTTVFADLSTINKFKFIKDEIDLKSYCKNLYYIKNLLYEYNTTSRQMINNICGSYFN